MSDTDLSFSEEAGHQVKCQLIEMSVGQLTNLKISKISCQDFKIDLSAPSDQPQSGYCRTRARQPVCLLINICHGSNICPFSFSSQLTNTILTVSVEQAQYLTDTCCGTGINNLFSRYEAVFYSRGGNTQVAFQDIFQVMVKERV